MSARETVAEIQGLLSSQLVPDGIPGALTQAAWQSLCKFAFAEHDGQARAAGHVIEAQGWPFTIHIEGEDLVVMGVTASWFGGDHDPLDNGETASGIRTKGNPTLLGCALAVDPHHPSTAGSPWTKLARRLPWRTKVIVQAAGASDLELILVDNGPAKSAKDAIDLTPQAFIHFASLSKGVIPVNFRIPGGAQFTRPA